MRRLLICRFVALGIAAGAVAAPMSVDAASWKLVFDAAQTDAGSFVADAGGGPVTASSILWDGILYDTPYPASPPEFDPNGDPDGAPHGFVTGPGGGDYGYFWNSAATSGCAALSCVMGLDYNGTYGEYMTGVGFMPTGTFDEATGAGAYRVAPVPLPAGLLLVLSGAAAVVWVGRGRRA